jgi:imidazole glycerol-phosphate synthase subunit HisH
MNRLSVGIVDYDVGNHASLQTVIQKLGYACKLSHKKSVLEECNLLILPGVGAFSKAMDGLYTHQLVNFLQDWAFQGKPLIGICLGMHLCADRGYEGGMREGLGIIPGEVNLIDNSTWHIGWNELNLVRRDPLFIQFESATFYFNHSYVFCNNEDVVIGVADHKKTFPSVIRHGSVIGLQFHPEKSQATGLRLLRHLIDRLCHA